MQSGYGKTHAELLLGAFGLNTSKGVRMSKVLKIIAALSFFCVMAACSGVGSTPEATAKAFIEKSYAGEADAALALMHLPKGTKPGEDEMLQGKIKATVAEQKDEAQQKGGVKEITVQPAEVDKNDPNHATAHVRIQFQNGTASDERVRLIKIDNKWKVFLGGGW